MSFGKNDITGAVSGFSNIHVWDAQGRLKVIGGGTPPPPAPVVWGTITGLVTNQTDLINYLGLNYYPLSSNPAGYITQAAADLLYYPLSSNPAGYITSAALTGYVPTTRTLTINGTSYDLSADRSWTIAAGGTVTSVELAAGTGISLSGTNPITTSGTITVTNDAPDQIVSLATTGTGLSVTGTYPSFTLENTLPDQTVVLTAGTGIGISGTYPSFTIDNTGLVSVPDLQQVTDVGATTTNTITIDAGGGTSTAIADYQIDITDGTNRVRIGTDYVAIRSNGSWDAFFASTNLTAGTLTLEVPDKTGTYTIATTDQLGLQNAITIDPVLTTSNIIDGGNFSLDFTNIYKFEVGAEQRARFQVDNGTDSANMYASPIDSATYLDYIKGGTQQTFISLRGDELRVGTPDVLTKSVGDVLTLTNPLTGEVEFQTPASGGGGIPFAIASGTDTYTATITGVTAYADGDAYIIRFTNGNTDAATLNINGLGAIPLHQNNQVPLIGGDIWAGGEMLCIYSSADNSFECIGTSPNSLFAYVTNDQGSTITKGQAVYAFSGTGNRMTVKLARADSDATSAQTIGVVYSASIAANQKGIIIIQGYLTGLSIFPTATWSDGDPIYLSPTTPGAFTKTKPYAPNHLVYCGILATASNGNAGRMYVRIQNGYELDELHNVQAQSPTYKDTLWYDNTVSPAQWKTASIDTILGYTPVPSTRTLTINGTAYDLSADRSWTIAGGGGSATIGTTIDGSGGTITAGQKGYVQIPYACTINSWRIIANASGSIVIDVWKAAAPTIPTVANTITGSALPTLSTQQTNASSTLTGWTTSVAANDIIGFNVNSATTVSWVILQLLVTKI